MAERRWIRASEVQSFAYCARSWWLRYILQLEPEDHGQWAAGTERHRSHGRRILRSEGLRRTAIVLLVLGLVVAAIALARFLGGG